VLVGHGGPLTRVALLGPGTTAGGTQGAPSAQAAVAATGAADGSLGLWELPASQSRGAVQLWLGPAHSDTVKLLQPVVTASGAPGFVTGEQSGREGWAQLWRSCSSAVQSWREGRAHVCACVALALHQVLLQFPQHLQWPHEKATP
jgi:hypothetical protein